MLVAALDSGPDSAHVPKRPGDEKLWVSYQALLSSLSLLSLLILSLLWYSTSEAALYSVASPLPVVGASVELLLVRRRAF